MFQFRFKHHRVKSIRIYIIHIHFSIHFTNNARVRLRNDVIVCRVSFSIDILLKVFDREQLDMEESTLNIQYISADDDEHTIESNVFQEKQIYYQPQSQSSFSGERKKNLNTNTNTISILTFHANSVMDLEQY